MNDLHVLDELEARLKDALYPHSAPRRIARRRWLAPLGGLAVAAAVAATVVVLVGSAGVHTSVAAALERAARAAQQRAPATTVEPGQFWYTRTSGVERLPLPILPKPPAVPPKGAVPATVALVQRVSIETWVGLDGTIRTRAVPASAQRFATPQDRARYLAAGNPLPHPNLGSDSTAQGDDRFPPSLDLFHYRELLSLPTDPHALYQRVHRALVAAQARVQREFANTQAELRRQQTANANFGVSQMIWAEREAQSAAELNAIKGLLETPVPPAVRAALYRAAALIPGVRYDGHVHDSLGRAGVGVSAGRPGSEFELIFDPATGALLGEHSPLIGDSATVAAGVVDSITALPKGVAPIAAPRSIARVPLAVRPAIGAKRTTFQVHLRQRVSDAHYSFMVTGPTGPACRPVLLPLAPPRFVGGSRAGRELVHRLRPPAGGWCAGSYKVQVLATGRATSGDLGSVRFRVR
jgi:hypothetical protein